ncbi:MAG: sulfatase-like hydrolase/transferase [Pirellulales bacterium]
MRLLVLTLHVLFIAAGVLAVELPNILWLTSEDNGPHLGCYGDGYAVTPNLDALAARGTRYTNAISNAPVCAPARTTIISGLYPSSTGAEHMRSQVHLPAAFQMFPQFLRKAGYYCTNNSKEDYNLAKPGRVWDDSSRKAHWQHRRAGQPFFAVFNHTITHESQIRNEISDADRIHDPAKVRLPAYHPDAPEVRRDWAQYYDRISMMDVQVGAKLQELKDAGFADDTIIFYFSDHGSGMPRSKRWLYMSGLNVPLIVYFPPKWQHLAPKDYAPGATSDRLVSFVDLAPSVLSLAGIKPPEWMHGGAFAGEFETEEPAFSYGFRGRMDERYDLVRSVRDKRYNYIRNYMPHRSYGQHLAYMFDTPTTRVWHRLYEQGKLNDAQAKFWEAKPAEELYDLKSDPDEIHNLAGSPKHREVLARMRQAHAEWVSQIKDVGFLSEWEMHARSREASPYEMGHNPQRYDFNAIFSAANVATSLKAVDLPKLVKLLDHQDSGIRYWAAVGLLAHQEAGVSTGHDKLIAALDDESPIVRITVAEALGRFGSARDAERALDVLLQYVKSEANYYLAVAAWNALDYLDERASPALETIKALPTKSNNVPPRMGEYPARLKAKTLADLE